MTAPLPEPRVRALLAAYGADPARWPAQEREAARAAILASPALAIAQEAARRTDALVDRAADPAPSAVFLGRALAAAPKRRAWPVPPWMLAGATAAVVIVAVSASWQMQRDALMRDADAAVELLITDIGDHS